MSSPIHLEENIETALIYVPPWARNRIPSSEGSTLQSRGASVEATEMSAKKSKPKFSGDRAVLKLQHQLALDPGLIPDPSSERAAVIRPLLVRLCSVGALAALVAWCLVSFSSVKNNVENIPAATSTSAIATSRVNVTDVQSLRLGKTTSRVAQTLVPAGQPEPITVATAATAAATPATVSVTAATSTDTTANAPTPPQDAMNHWQLRPDSEEIDVLIKRGKDLLADGDVAAARLLLRRAAEAGSAEGAFTLGTTFDPVLLAHLGVIGATADLAKARRWYQRAIELGSSAASQQLAGLADAH